MVPLAPEQAEDLVRTILTGPTIDRASALFDLIKLVADPAGDKDKYEGALNAMRAVDPMTKEYELWFQGRVAQSSASGPRVNA